MPILLAFFLFAQFLSTLSAEPAYITFPSDIPWVTRSSAHFNVLYRDGQDELAVRALKAGERAHRLLTPIFQEFPEKTWMVIADFQDSTNGYAIDFPYPHMVIFASPPEASAQLSSLDDWFSSVILHEYVHVLHLYPAHGLWSLMRTVFGSWVIPNGMLPSHLHEGMATFFETHFSKGGRGRGALFKMYRRMAVEEGAWGTDFSPLDLLDGSKLRWPHGTSAYFFGYTLHDELFHRKGKEGIWDLTLSYSNNWPYLVHGPAKEIFGKNYNEIWNEIYQKTLSSTKEEINNIKQQDLSPLTYLTQSRFHKWDLTLSPDGKEAVYRTADPEKLPHLEIISTQDGKVVDSIEITPSSSEGICFYGNDVFFINPENTDYYSTNVLFRWNRIPSPASGTVSKVNSPADELKNLHHLSCNKTGGIISNEMGGIGHVREWHWGKNGEMTWGRSWDVPRDHWVNGLVTQEIWQDNRPGKRQGKHHWIILRKDYHSILYEWSESSEPQPRLTVPARLFSPRDSGREDSLYVISDFDQRNEIVEIFPSKKTIKRKIALLGGSNSFDVVSDQFFITSYRHGGFDVAKAGVIAEPTKAIGPLFRQVGEKDGEGEQNTTISEKESYSPLGTLRPRAWIPSFLAVTNGFQLGAWIPSFDISQKHLIDLYGGYDSRGLPFASLIYQYRFGKNYSFDITPYYSPSYLTSTKDFIKRWGGVVGVGGTPVSFLPSIHLSALFRRIEEKTNPSLQSVGFGISLSKSFGFPRRAYSVSPVNGVALSLRHEWYFKALSSDDNFFSTSASIQQYWEAPWWKKSVWYLGTKMAYTEGTRLINSYYEAGGELLFYQTRGVYLNRGFLSGTFVGRRLFDANLEYRFPVARVERGWGLSPLFLEDIHAALVADTTSVDFGVSSPVPAALFQKFYSSAGIELRSRWKVGYYLPGQLRLGVYHGFGDLAEAQPINITLGVEAGL